MNDPIAKYGNRRFRNANAGFDDPIHIEDLESIDNDPFHEVESKPNRWLITTCIAGVAGTLVIGGAILGLFSENATTPARASIPNSDGWQRPAVAAKSDLNGSFTKTVKLRDYREVAVAQTTGTNSSTLTNTTILRPESELPLTNVSLTGNANQRPPVVIGSNVQFASILPSNNTTILKKLPPEPVDETFFVSKGETLIDKLVALGVARATASQLAAKLEPVFPSKLIKAGQKFVVTLDKQQDFFGNFVIYPVELTFSPGPNEEIAVESNEEGRFFVRINGKKNKAPSRYAAPRSQQFRIAGRITSSLFAAALDKGVPEYIINQTIRAFSHAVDFQRDVSAGAKFEIYFGLPLSGSKTRRKVVHYASLQVRGKSKELYRFTDSSGKTSYYDPQGRGATKFLMKTPINGVRISSGFGMRRHPVLGYSKMHTGIDFAAPRGTPIKAAGDGTIKFRGWRGGYGRFVVIKHTNGYVTRYAHMSRFAKGLSKGSPVRQGQVIGYVGASGRVTGAHLHYEVRINNRFINPRRVRVAGKVRLKGNDLTRFMKHRKRVIALMKKVPTAQRFASVAQ